MYTKCILNSYSKTIQNFVRLSSENRYAISIQKAIQFLFSSFWIE